MKKLNILIVEDEGIISMDIETRLKRLDYNVAATVMSGEDAIEYVSKNQVDLILMDIMLEGEMDGIDTAKEIIKRHSIPIVYLTSYADNSTLKRAKVDNTFGYVLKPFNDNDLHIAIEIAIHRFDVEAEKNKLLNEAGTENNKKIKVMDFILKNDKKKIPVWMGDELIVLNPSDVYYLEINIRNLNIHTSQGVFSMRGTLKEWEERLKEYNFFRCHKCYLVNLDKIQKLIVCIDNSCLVKMVDLPEKIPLSRHKVQTMKDAIMI